MPYFATEVYMFSFSLDPTYGLLGDHVNEPQWDDDDDDKPHEWQWRTPRIKPREPTDCAVCCITSRKPRRRFGVHCDHTFCETCLKTLYNRGMFNCPLCREKAW